MACLCAANADDLTVEKQFLQQSGMQEDTRTLIRNDEVTALHEQNAMLKAQNQALREFQDGIFATLWSVIGMVVVFIGLLTYFQSKISDREAQSIKEEAIKPLRKIAMEYGKFFLVSLHAQGRRGRGNLDKFEIRTNLEKFLRETGLSETEISVVIDVEFKWVCRDYYDYSIDPINETLAYKHSDSWTAFNQSHQGLDETPTPYELRSFILRLDILDADTDERLEDYKHYFENKTHRNPNKWRKRHN